MKKINTTPKIEKSNRREVVAFRIHYADGEILEGNHAYQWQRAPVKDVMGVEFFYDDWADGEPRREYITGIGEYIHPELERPGLPGTTTPKRLLTKLEGNQFKKPDSINPTKEGDFHEMPLETMKGA